MNLSLFPFVALSLLPISSAAQFRLASPPPTGKLIHAGRILDVKSGKYMLDQGILTEGDRIKEVGPWDQLVKHAPNHVVKIDLSQAVVLPGLIDCH